MQWRRGEFLIVDDPGRVDVDAVTGLLALTHWGYRRPREVVRELVRHSLCLSLLRGEEQVGFARAATDYTVFSWLSDLVVAEAHRGKGLGGWLLGCMLEHPRVARTQFVLQTTHSHAWYEKFGFAASAKLMSRLPP